MAAAVPGHQGTVWSAQALADRRFLVRAAGGREQGSEGMDVRGCP